jgi:multidrug efflux pump subunit AcrA (membrane-fusion protein)
LSERHATLQAAIASNAAAAKAKEDQTALEAELATMRQEYKRVDASLQTAKVALAEAEAEYKRLLDQRARNKQQAEATAVLAKARTELAVLKELCNLLAELQSKLVDAAICPLLDKANSLFRDVLGRKLIYHEGDIGFHTKQGRFYSHRTFSGTEKALAYSALSVALASTAPLRLVVIDELGRLDDGNKAKLLTQLCHLCDQDVIDQAVVVDVAIPAFVPKSVNIIHI